MGIPGGGNGKCQVPKQEWDRCISETEEASAPRVNRVKRRELEGKVRTQAEAGPGRNVNVIPGAMVGPWGLSEGGAGPDLCF